MNERKADVHWDGRGKQGEGRISTESNAVKNVPYGFATRFEDDRRGTNPEELIAAAHAACFTMAFSFACDKAGYATTAVDTRASVRLVAQGDGFAIDQLMIMDPWDTPILYYKANRAAQRMVSSSDSQKGPGIYSQEDNAIITGSVDGVVTETGLDFGAGKVQSPGAAAGQFHAIVSAKSPDATPSSITSVRTVRQPLTDRPRRNIAASLTSASRSPPGRRMIAWAQSTNAGWASA